MSRSRPESIDFGNDTHNTGISILNLLPKDLLQLILKNCLNTNQQLLARLVCKEWFQMIKMPQGIDFAKWPERKGEVINQLFSTAFTDLINIRDKHKQVLKKLTRGIVQRVKALIDDPYQQAINQEIVAELAKIAESNLVFKNLNFQLLDLIKNPAPYINQQLIDIFEHDIDLCNKEQASGSKLCKQRYESRALLAFAKKHEEITKKILDVKIETSETEKEEFFKFENELSRSRGYRLMKSYVNSKIGFWHNLYGDDFKDVEAEEKPYDQLGTGERDLIYPTFLCKFWK